MQNFLHILASHEKNGILLWVLFFVVWVFWGFVLFGVLFCFGFGFFFKCWHFKNFYFTVKYVKRRKINGGRGKEKTLKSSVVVCFCMMLLLSSLLLFRFLFSLEKCFWRFPSDSRWALPGSLPQKSWTMSRCSARVLTHQFRGVIEVSTASIWKLKNTLFCSLS